MENTYNFILHDLLCLRDDKELTNKFCHELVNGKINLEVEYLSEQQLAAKPYAELKSLLDQGREANYLKLSHVKAQNFEGAASCRERERKLLNQIETAGFRLHFMQHNEFTLYRVDMDKEERKIKFLVHTNSEEFIGLMEEIREKIDVMK